MIPLPAEGAGEVYHRCSVSLLGVFPQKHLAMRDLAQGKEVETSQAAGRYRACASPAAQSNGQLVEKADCTGIVNQKLVLLGELPLVPLLKARKV